MITIVIGFLVGFFLGGWWWLSLVVIPYFYISLSRKMPRGYLKHLSYRLGLYSYKGYPHYFQNQFDE